ncbi:methyltransferase regulatory domain-containing protein [Neorhodopirellula pilleata]|uniref:tRNA (Guanine-N(7)-)-methyltransferase n=1 Tax=Neorhodopirellula pilleata TaxID=2714738 RepID=A0A5C5ZPM8_9BACT|nr:class I SAM-dependent methyltransferase [Neorhodopirellula pilleata]TWT89180.1 tRNA (guanine-N(7)-)-methyltransferase [Neorhodopirellula pilleata]
MNRNETAYDALPYPDFIHAKTNPNNLAALAVVMGMSPRDPHACRVLEIACGTGANLISLATIYPDSQFVGFDLSAKQIEQGSRWIDELKLSNIELHCDAIESYSPPAEGFDYVIAQGIYSWVPEDVADDLLKLCGRALSDHGLAFVSYNTYPGWHAKQMVRELLHQPTDEGVPRLQRFERGMQFLREVVQAVPEETAYGITLREELAALQRSDPRYVAHEQFEEINRPSYFKTFAAAAKAHGLAYLCEANFNNLHRANFTASQILELQDLPLIEREQRIDYFRRRTFRHSVLTRVGTIDTSTLSWGVPKASQMNRLSMTSSVVSERHPAEWDELLRWVQTHDAVRFGTTDGIVATVQSLPTKLALLLLHRTCPCSMTLTELVAAIRLITPAALDAGSPPDLANELMELAVAGMIEIHMAPVQISTEVSSMPTAAPLSRRYALTSDQVPNRFHQSIRLDEPTRLIIQHADGDHGHADLEKLLVDFFSSGPATLQLDGADVIDPEKIARYVSEKLPGILRTLAEKGFFIA